MYKVKKDLLNAKRAYVSAGDLYSRCERYRDSAKSYYEASKIEEDVELKISLLISAAENYTLCPYNVLNRVAEIYGCIAKVYESDFQYSKAVKYYEQSAELYDTIDHSESLAIKMLEKVAELSIALEEYSRAIEIYTGLANKRSGTIAYLGSAFYIKTIILHCVIEDIIAAKRLLESIESTLLSGDKRYIINLLNAIENSNEQDFLNTIRDRENMDNITIGLLTKIKNQLFVDIKDEEDDLS